MGVMTPPLAQKSGVILSVGPTFYHISHNTRLPLVQPLMIVCGRQCVPNNTNEYVLSISLSQSLRWRFFFFRQAVLELQRATLPRRTRPAETDRREGLNNDIYQKNIKFVIPYDSTTDVIRSYQSGF